MKISKLHLNRPVCIIVIFISIFLIYCLGKLIICFKHSSNTHSKIDSMHYTSIFMHRMTVCLCAWHHTRRHFSFTVSSFISFNCCGIINRLTHFQFGKFNFNIILIPNIRMQVDSYKKKSRKKTVWTEANLPRYTVGFVLLFLSLCNSYPGFFSFFKILHSVERTHKHQKHILDCLCSAAMPNWKYIFYTHLL